MNLFAVKNIKNYFTLSLLALLSWSCDRYIGQSDTIQDIPPTNNLTAKAILDVLQEIEEDYPEDAEVLFKKAWLYFEREEDTLALESIQKAISLDSTKGQYYDLLGKIYRHQNQVDLSLEASLNAKNLGLSEVELSLFISELLIQKKNFTEAGKYLNEVEKVISKDARIHYLRGNIAMQKYDSATAFRELDKALKIRPDYADVYNSLAEIYINYEQYYLALGTLNKGLKIAPKHYFLNFNKASILQARNELDSAKYYFEQSYKANPNEYLSSLNLGILNFKIGQYKDAERYLKHTLSLEEKQSEAHYYLGICYVNKNENQLALTSFERSLELDPDNYSASDYYWSTKGKIELARMRAVQDSLLQVYYKRQQELMEQYQNTYYPPNDTTTSN